ncbi:LexA-binding, inner membrane-associated putative hydrolase [Desulfonauticus submarinus]|uniref:LexA-binding, inner membrane-associated putative hydrolase n=1 Tax=Desulfonauticus submarinus TaxID=206665 RepID=A0A1H0CQR6_9BACT|nr:metal-dependent hydrolase [Desulfonauticus submarinus]SDN60176.1 LexA-binding, inner membrane-associated putative hydrolase [Desulfonauticus submarinus]
MPGYKGHIGFGGLFVGGLIFLAIWLKWWSPSLVEVAMAFCIGVLGALFPDIDTDSKGQNLFYAILVCLDLALIIKAKYKLAALLGFIAMLPALGSHRSWTHTWWAMLLLPFPILILPYIFYHYLPTKFFPYYLAAVFGYFSHLLLDRKLF